MRYLAIHSAILLGTLMGAIAFSSLARAEPTHAWPAEISASIEVADCAALETDWDAGYDARYKLGALLTGQAREGCRARNREFLGSIGLAYPYSCEAGIMSASFTVGCAFVF
jgi:hypothetical protein